jgi:hypothetical protein
MGVVFLCIYVVVRSSSAISAHFINFGESSKNEMTPVVELAQTASRVLGELRLTVLADSPTVLGLRLLLLKDCQ